MYLRRDWVALRTWLQQRLFAIAWLACRPELQELTAQGSKVCTAAQDAATSFAGSLIDARARGVPEGRRAHRRFANIMRPRNSEAVDRAPRDRSGLLVERVRSMPRRGPARLQGLGRCAE